MLRFVVSAVAANMVLFQFNSHVPIALARSTWIGNSLNHGIIGTMSLEDLEGALLQKGCLTRYCPFPFEFQASRTISDEPWALKRFIRAP